MSAAKLGVLETAVKAPGAGVAELVHQSPHQPRVLDGVVGGRQPALVVGEAGDVGVEAGAEVRHFRGPALRRAEGDVRPRLLRRRPPLHQLDLGVGESVERAQHLALGQRARVEIGDVSARLKASRVRSTHSWTEAGARAMISWSPWVPHLACSMSPWAGSVGWPVDGPDRCTLTITHGVSVMQA